MNTAAGLQETGRPRRASFTRLCFVVAPALLVGYGVLRIVDGIQDHHGPGFWWTASHMLFLASLLAFGVVLAVLVRLSRGGTTRWLGCGIAVVAAAGLVLTIRTVAIDLAVGLIADDRASMNRLYGAYRNVPIPIPSVASSMAPAAFFAAMTMLLVLLALPPRRRVAWWVPALSVGTAFIQIDPYLAPVGAGMLLVALLDVPVEPSPARA